MILVEGGPIERLKTLAASLRDDERRAIKSADRSKNDKIVWHLRADIFRKDAGAIDYLLAQVATLTEQNAALREAASDLCDVLHDKEFDEHFDDHHDDECPLCDGYARVRAALQSKEPS